MSSQKKPSFWQRLKYLLTAEEDNINSQADNAQSQPLPQKREADNCNNSQNQQPESGENLKSSAGSDQSTTHGTEEGYSQSASEQASVKLISWSNLDEADHMQLSTTSVQASENPITDSIIDFLEASDLSYYYHEPAAESDFNDSNQDPADEPSTNQTQKHQGSASKRNVHHISMAMRYYQEGSENDTADTDAESSDDTQSAIEKGEVEWGCVIRVHEHTQLVAFYGVLPFQLPESHLQAGMTLATQLNYDMMLGCVEIDIRDGEIRFKNSLDLEPTINANGGSVPPTVISYLLKGVMAMTASFAPLFSDLIASNPQEFELDTLLEQLSQAQMDRTFFLATQMVQ